MKHRTPQYWRYYICQSCGRIVWAAASCCPKCRSLLLFRNPEFATAREVAYSRRYAEGRRELYGSKADKELMKDLP